MKLNEVNQGKKRKNKMPKELENRLCAQYVNLIFGKALESNA